MKIRPLFLLVLSASASIAAPLWDIDFDSMAAGSAPSLQSPALAGQVNTLPTTLTNTGAGNTVLVTSGFSANGTTMTGNSLVFDKGIAGTQELALVGNSEDYVATTNYQLSFDLLVDSQNLGQPLNLRLTTTDANTSVASLTFDMSGAIILTSSLSSTSALTLTNVWEPASLNSIVVQVDATSKTVFALVDGTLVGQIDLDLANETTNPLGVGRVRFRNNSTNQLYAYGFGVDNIFTTTELSPIPEPGTLALGVLGIAALAAGGRVRRLIFA